VQRAIYDAVMAHLAALGPVHVDAVRVGVFRKSERKFAEVRPMARRRGPRVHVVRATDPADVDDQLRCWLTEAYGAAS
jgi:hypothetical protein